MIGGMSWESSAIYYWMVNEVVKGTLGGHHSAETVMYSVDFAQIKRLQHEGRWEETAASLAEAARKVERGGADFLLLCTNTMHRVANAITEAVSIPLLHIADTTAEEVKARGIKSPVSPGRGPGAELFGAFGGGIVGNCVPSKAGADGQNSNCSIRN
jgi:aspartate racemase